MKSLLVLVALVGISAISLSAQETERTQTIRGTVVDVVTNAPLRGATVKVLLKDSVLGGSITDKSGAFRIKEMPVGRLTVRISFLGYEPFILEDLLVTAGKEVVLPVTMKEAFATVEAVGVESDRITDVAITNNEYVNVSGRPFNTEDTKRYAGSLGDPSRMAANYAGVSSANDSRNDIVVRGNSPQGMLWRMEGMNIPNPNHFGALSSQGGPVSMLNNNVLAKSDFITSAYPAMYGNGLSGAFDLRLREGNSQQYEFMTQMGFNGLEVGAEGPMGGGSSFLANYRYSTLALFNALGISFGTGGATPVYQDATALIQTPVGDGGKLSFFGVGGLSDVDFLGNEADTTENNYYSGADRNTRVRYKTGWAGVSFEQRFGENTTGKATAGVSGTFERFDGDSINPITREAYHDAEAEFVTQTLSGVINLRHKFSRNINLEVGGFVDAQTFSLYNVDNLGLPNERVNVDQDGSAVLTQGYAQLRNRFTDWLSTNVGVHVQHYTQGDAFAVEPRVGVTANLSPTLSLNAGYGLHSQRQGIYTYAVQTPGPTGPLYTNENLGFTRAHHAVLGTDWFATDKIRIKLEGYYQSLFDAPVTAFSSSYSALNQGNDFAPDTQDSLVNEGTGTNLGAELTVEHFFSDGLYFLLTGSLFDSKYKGSDGIERNTAFNTNYVVNLLGGKEFDLGSGSIIGLNVRFTTTGGRYLTPIDLEQSAIEGETVLDYTNAYSERQSPYLRLDLKFVYRVEFAHSSLEFAIDLQNVTNNQNVFSQDYDPKTGQIVTQYQQGFFPVPMVKYTF